MGDRDSGTEWRCKANERNKASRQKQWKENYEICRDSSFAAQEPSKSRGRVLSRVRFTVCSASTQLCFVSPFLLLLFLLHFVRFSFCHIIRIYTYFRFFPLLSFHSSVFFSLSILFSVYLIGLHFSLSVRRVFWLGFFFINTSFDRFSICWYSFTAWILLKNSYTEG